MGGYISKEWTEVNTTGSPEAPSSSEVSEGAVARRRILKVDPRSISDDVTRTPIQVDKSPKVEDVSTPKNAAHAYIDPRSPSLDLPRTPLAPALGKQPLYFDDSLEIGTDAAAPIAPPKRGAIANDLKDIECKIEELVIESEEKEEGELTHDSDGEEDSKPLEKSPVIMKPKMSFMRPVITEKVAMDSTKEEGEITHDSDDDENEENIMPINKTPTMKPRMKSSLENDCRSPLLIDHDDKPVFEKVLTNELAAMAERGKKKLSYTSKNENPDSDSLIQEKNIIGNPLMEINNTNDDSLVI